MSGISVAIPAGNRFYYLDKCLKSLGAMNKIPQEVVVVDNSTSNLVKKVVNKYKSVLCLRYIKESRKGIPYARNACVEAANYDVVAFIDDDCVTHFKWLDEIEKNVSLLEKGFILQGGYANVNRDNVFAEVMYFFNSRYLRSAVHESKADKKNYRNHDIINFLDTKNFVFSKKILKKTRGFFDDKYILGGDIEFLHRLQESGVKIVYTPSIMVDHHYVTNLSDFVRKLMWARRVKMQTERSKHAESLKRIEDDFGQAGLEKMLSYYKRKMQLVNKAEKQLENEIFQNKGSTFRKIFKIFVASGKVLQG